MLWAGKRGSSCDWGRDTMPKDPKRTGTELFIFYKSNGVWRTAPRLRYRTIQHLPWH